MAIGPEARRLASGRVVVAAGVLGVFGVAALVLGIGPIVEDAGEVERGLGLAAMTLGAVMLAGAIALGLRRGPARTLGIAGGVSATALGGLVAMAAVLSLERCGTADETVACSLILGGAALVGLVVAAAGAAVAVVVNRARPEALRRRRER